MPHAALDTPQTGDPIVSPATATGAIIGLQGDVLQGWALDAAQPEQRLIVEVLIDGASVAIARADQYEPGAPEGDQFHGFAVQLRQSWLNEARTITAQIANTDLPLQGEVQIPAAPALDTSAVASQVWHTGGLRLSGWAWDPKAPRRHLQISVREGGREVAQATCDQHHQALAYRASADHGFSLDLPWELADGELHVLEVVNDLGQPLPGSPVRLRCLPEGLEGLLQQLPVAEGDQTLALLGGIAREQALRLPKSAGWHLYPQWFDAFQRLDEVPTPTLQGALGILLISDGDNTLEQASLASLGADRIGVQALATTPPHMLTPGLRQLLEAGCDRILPLVAGDRLAGHALTHLSALLDDGSAWGYADCDRDGAQGERSFPWFKPTWDIDLFIGADIFMPGAIFGKAVIEQAMLLLPARSDTQACNWHELSAAVALATQSNQLCVSHLPRVLYHRAHPAAASPEQAATCPERQQAISWLCERLAAGATVSTVDNYPALLRAHWPLPVELPRVSLIVPTRDQHKLLAACMEGLLNDTDYPNLELIVVDNQSSDPQTLEYLTALSERGVTVLRHPFPFNYSTINNRAATLATGDMIGLVNNDIEIIDSGWLKEMVAQLLRPNVGAVGAKLLWPNRMVQHGGVVVGINGLAAHSGNTLSEEDPGYLGFNQLTRRQSAVTAACMLMRKAVFDEVGGLDELTFPVAFNDVDLCLRIQQLGLHLVWSAFARLIHAESASRGKDLAPEKRARAQREQQKFIERWTIGLYNDPFYHPALASDYLTGPYGGLMMPLGGIHARKQDPQSVCSKDGR
ncbi:glycosyltransferase family 2 protein [Pseudomonas sp. CIP-10]|uniref:glycosyltransferase family 2 protein n=1 Tax=Pseudomonas sp. CIP-10 TaxID=2892442 RepID=UPI001E29A480|nr:glycosyltransferase family 2 protein [Pseudomonas sp. CIP-10]UFH25793.1 glycosyltransferase family 2 protein [Pseudomonas sp. CIP-10]